MARPSMLKAFPPFAGNRLWRQITGNSVTSPLLLPANKAEGNTLWIIHKKQIIYLPCHDCNKFLSHFII